MNSVSRHFAPSLARSSVKIDTWLLLTAALYMNKYWLLLVFPVGLVCWWALGHGETATVIHFASAQRITIESVVSTNGKVEPAQWAAARAEAAGVVRTIKVERGAFVKAGQELVSLDTAAAASELASALARRQEAKTESETVNQGGKAAVVANLDDSLRSAQVAEQAAQRNFDSLTRLVAQQAATKIQLQDAKDALDRAKLQVAAIQDQKKTLVTAPDKSVAMARVSGAQAAVDLAQRNLSLSVIRSPIDGTLYQFDLKPGAYLQPGDLVGFVGNLEQVKVTIYVDEPDLGRVALGMPVTITWDADPGRKWSGYVDKLPTAIVALGTRTVGEVSTIVTNPNHALLPGVSVNATIVSKVVKDAIGIPKAALHTMRGQAGVYKLSQNTIQWTPVVAGVSDLNNVQIISGLEVSAKVADRVVDPTDAELKNNMRVRAQFN